MAAKEFTVVIIGGGISALEAIPHLLKKGPTATVAVVTGNSFLEFPMGASIFLHNPDEHKTWISGDPANWKNRNQRVTYFHNGVASADCDNKTILLGDKVTTIKYKAVIVATGGKMPLIAPKVGASLSERHAEVRAYGEACAKAKTVVFNGPGLIGVEFCGDFRVHHGYEARVILLTRSGKILDTDFGEKSEKPKLEFVEHVSSILREKFKVEIKQGSPTDRAFSEPHLSPGTLQLDNGEQIQYDLYMPTYGQGPNTGFLKSSKPDFLQSGRIQSNECLQSTVHPEVFGVNVTTFKLYGHPLSSRVTAAAKCCAENAVLVAEGRAPKPFQDKEGPPPMTYPMNVKIGHGKGGYMLWVDAATFGPLFCMPCKGGFPFCPPPCCWCILPGSIKGCGSCCGEPEGEGPAVFMKSGLLPLFAPAHKYFGIGKVGPDAPAQLKM